jgi:hypothetical protein
MSDRFEPKNVQSDMRKPTPVSTVPSLKHAIAMLERFPHVVDNDEFPTAKAISVLKDFVEKEQANDQQHFNPYDVLNSIYTAVSLMQKLFDGPYSDNCDREPLEKFALDIQILKILSSNLCKQIEEEGEKPWAPPQEDEQCTDAKLLEQVLQECSNEPAEFQAEAFIAALAEKYAAVFSPMGIYELLFYTLDADGARGQRLLAALGRIEQRKSSDAGKVH